MREWGERGRHVFVKKNSIINTVYIPSNYGGFDIEIYRDISGRISHRVTFYEVLSTTACLFICGTYFSPSFVKHWNYMYE